MLSTSLDFAFHPFPTPIDGFGGNDDSRFECEVNAQVVQVMQVIDLSCLKDLTSH